MYKDNFKLFFTLSLIMSSITLASNIFTLWSTGIESTVLKTSMMFPTMFVSILVLYFSIRFLVAFKFAFRYRLLGHRTTIGESFRKSNAVTWKYLGAILTIVVIILIPAMLIVIAQTYGESFFGKSLLIMTGTILIAFLHTRYGFLPYIKVFEPDAKNSLDYSRNLVKNNFFKSMVILALPMVSGLVLSWIKPIFAGAEAGISSQIAFSVFIAIVNAALWPLMAGITIQAFFILDKKINKEKYVWTNKSFGNLSEAESYTLLKQLMDIWDISREMKWYPLKETNVITSDYRIEELVIKEVENLVWEKYPDDIYILSDGEDIIGKCIPAFNLELKDTGKNKFFFDKSLEWLIYISEEGHIVFGGMDLIMAVKELNKSHI